MGGTNNLTPAHGPHIAPAASDEVTMTDSSKVGLTECPTWNTTNVGWISVTRSRINHLEVLERQQRKL